MLNVNALGTNGVVSTRNMIAETATNTVITAKTNTRPESLVCLKDQLLGKSLKMDLSKIGGATWRGSIGKPVGGEEVPMYHTSRASEGSHIEHPSWHVDLTQFRTEMKAASKQVLPITISKFSVRYNA